MTTAEIITSAIAVLGVLGQLYISGRNDGKREEQASEMRRRVTSLEVSVGRHDKLLTTHNSRIATIASKCQSLFGPAKWGRAD